MEAQRGGKIIDTPSRGRAVVIRWLAGGHGHPSDLVSGGKAPRPTWPRRILEPGEPLREIPGAPQTHGLAITVQLGGDSAIRGLGGGGCPQDQATTARQRLR